MTKLCECGCGQPAPIAKLTNTKLGHVKGQPIRFVNGHQRSRVWGAAPDATERQCTKCLKVLPLDAFYKTAKGKFGRTSRCRECIRADVRANQAQVNESAKLWRERNPDYLRNYRKAPEVRKKVAEQGAQQRKNNPDKARARDIIGNEIRRGRLVPQPCQFCGKTKTQAHHPDYSKPLEVVWVCSRCHYEQFHKRTAAAQS